MKIKSYHVFLVSMVALGMMCLPILGSASYWELEPNHSNEAKWEPYPGRYGKCTANLRVNVHYYTSGNPIGAAIYSYSGSVYDNTIWIYKDVIGTAHAGRGSDSYLYCYISATFVYTPGSNIVMYVKAYTYWNDNAQHYYDIDTFTEY